MTWYLYHLEYSLEITNELNKVACLGVVQLMLRQHVLRGSLRYYYLVPKNLEYSKFW